MRSALPPERWPRTSHQRRCHREDHHESGALSGKLSAASFGTVPVTGGNFSGSLTSPTPAATLDKIAAPKSLTITDGDVSGDVRIGTANPGSYFAAGLFKATPKIAGVKVDPTTDARFKVG